MSATVRPARIEDAGAIGRIQVQSWQATYSGLVPDHYLDAMSIPAFAARWHVRIRRPERDRRIWVIVKDGEDGDDGEQPGVAGFAETGPSRDDDVPPGTAELYVIYMDPAASGRGLGRQLMRAVVQDLRERRLGLLTVWVLDGNRPARRFYEACGMALDGGAKVELFHAAAVFEVRYRLDLRA